MKIISETGAKTDIIDAAKIADVLYMGMIPNVACQRHPPGTTGRYCVPGSAWRRTGPAQSRLRNMPDKYDIEITASKIYAKKVLAALEETELDGPADMAMLEQCTRQIRYFNEERRTEPGHIGKGTGQQVRQHTGQHDRD